MRTFLLIIFTFIYSGVFAQSQSIHLISPGFLLQSSKKASVIGTAEAFEIKQVAGQKFIFNGEISSPAFQKDGNQNVAVADISSLIKAESIIPSWLGVLNQFVSHYQLCNHYLIIL